jgi:hypothetical protein
MNRDPVTTAIAIILLLSVTATAGLCYWFLQSSRQHQIAQSEWNLLNRNRALLQSLGTDALEYSRKNPEIIPVLQNLGFRGRVESNNPTK